RRATADFLLPENNLTPKPQSTLRQTKPSVDHNASLRRAACNSFRRVRPRAAIHEIQLHAPAWRKLLCDTSRNQAHALPRRDPVLIPGSIFALPGSQCQTSPLFSDWEIPNVLHDQFRDFFRFLLVSVHSQITCFSVQRFASLL